VIFAYNYLYFFKSIILAILFTLIMIFIKDYNLILLNRILVVLLGLPIYCSLKDFYWYRKRKKLIKKIERRDTGVEKKIDELQESNEILMIELKQIAKLYDKKDDSFWNRLK